jgi:hypothetical protein
MTGPEFLAWRQSLSLAQQGAAGALGLNLRTVQRYEAGTLPIPLCAALACRWLETERTLRAILDPAAAGGRASIPTP